MSHAHQTEAPHGPSGPASVMADVGGDVGAAVLYVPQSLAGLEIEIRPVGSPWDGRHTAVRERHLGDSVSWAAFFGSLAAGRYELRVKGSDVRDSRAVELEVSGGHVAEVNW
jgi:hypothetical protein